MRRWGAILAAVLFAAMLVTGPAGNLAAEEQETPGNRWVEELRQWDWSLGGAAYLRRADEWFYAAGAKRDLGQFFTWLSAERLYFEVGYLNSKAFSGAHEYGYTGLSTNANHVVQLAVDGVNKLVGGTFETPAILNTVMAHVGLVAAKRWDEDFWTVDKGWDYGAVVAIIRTW